MQSRAARLRRSLLAGYLAAQALACRPPTAATVEMPPPVTIPVVAEAPPPDHCDTIVRIEVHKAARRLEAWCANGFTREVGVAIGRGAPGPKRRSMDRRTPEGLYRVSGPARESRFHLFVPIDYPSLEDAERARAAGELEPQEHARIAEAHARGEEPPGDTVLGGGIGLHGRGEDWADVDPRLDWTLGCVAVGDEEIEWLAEHAPVGTPVRIAP